MNTIKSHAELKAAEGEDAPQYYSVKWTRPMHRQHGRRFIWTIDGKFYLRLDAVDYANRYLRRVPDKGDYEIVEWKERTENERRGTYPVSEDEYEHAQVIARFNRVICFNRVG